MRSASVASTVLHAAILTWGLWSFGQPEPLEMGGEALPVSLVPIEEFSQATQGEESAPVKEKPAPTPTKTPAKLPMPAENVGDNETDLPTPPAPKPSPRESVQTAAAEAPPPPPTPAAVPKPPEPTPAPKPAEPTPAPPVETAEAKPDTAPPEETAPIDELSEIIAKAPPVPEPPRNVPLPQLKPKPPEPVKVAEAKPAAEPAKPTPPAKVTEPTREKTTDKAKDAKKPSTQTSEDKFDADAIAALLNKQESSGGGAKRSTEQASLGVKKATGGTLSQTEMDALRGQISKCWNPPAGNTDAGGFRVKISMQLTPSGEVEGMPQIVQGGGSTGAERAAGEAAVRAVRRCAPYSLPAEKYDTWAQVTVNFDPSQMF